MAPSHLHRIAFLVCCVISSLAGAAVSVGPVFSDHMVLQRGMDVPVWGEAKAGERVTVEFLGKKLNATADEKGQWQVKLPAMGASGDAGTLSVRGDDETVQPIVFNDVLVGDVWICSGQSNMGFLVKQAKEADK